MDASGEICQNKLARFGGQHAVQAGLNSFEDCSSRAQFLSGLLKRILTI